MPNKQILMSSPEYFKVEYSINPWMVSGTEVDLDLAKHQWENLKTTIETAGAEVKVVQPNENYPDLVFTANSGIINKNDVLIANFKYEERRGEEELYSKWFKDNGYNVSRIPSEFKFEGRGDAFVYGDNEYTDNEYKAFKRSTARKIGIPLNQLDEYCTRIKSY